MSENKTDNRFAMGIAQAFILSLLIVAVPLVTHEPTADGTILDPFVFELMGWLIAFPVLGVVLFFCYRLDNRLALAVSGAVILIITAYKDWGYPNLYTQEAIDAYIESEACRRCTPVSYLEFLFFYIIGLALLFWAMNMQRIERLIVGK